MKKFVVILCTYFLLSPLVYAYEFVNPQNQSGVESARDDIYSLKNMYIELVGEDEIEDEIEYTSFNSDKYWWPIGSREIVTSNGKIYASGEPEETSITSTFGYRGAVVNSSGKKIAGDENHGAIDIANTRGVGVTNIIAAKNGVVVYPTEKSPIDCKNGDSRCTGYGNYIVIQHSDGNYTLYAHLHENSITVKAGDSVDQGQVIAKMGSSGNSTGSHLHFEVRLGENNSASRVDPLEYVDKNNPRPKSSGGDASLSALLDYINQFEGTGCWNQLSEEGDNYVACIGNDGVITVGHGVVWESNMSRFKARGVSNVVAGSRISKNIVDDIQLEILTELHDRIVEDLAAAGIDSLKDYQVNALASQAYNGGYTVIKGNSYGYGFIENWKKYNGKYQFEDIYKHQGSLWLDSLCRPYSPGSANELGLQRRRVSEWMMFIDGTMDHLESGFDPSRYAWPE